MNYCNIIASDVANGKGVRTSIFVSGCRNHCKGCFNPETWDFNFGQEFTDDTRKLIYKYVDDEYHKGITLLGGDPMEPENVEVLLPFLREFKDKFPDKDVWCYTGYRFETLDKEILQYIDVLIDGKFELDHKSETLPFRGSSNQRVIDVQLSLKYNVVIEKEIT